eukprot:TRINITY_DN25953_c1_g1_i11.p1 TRINITY_DN25953_c1_g1~~TRINITY_DN25953_c1_g1_i11.p1  ORF type:complete len:337 (-),score=41.16 TRINITY_DN25953_c1_g1_i11:125-1135(-)
MADFEDDWGEDSGETTPLPVPSTAKIWLSVLVGAAVVVCLPDDAACKSEMLWLWRARLRRQLLGFLEAVVKSPLVQLVAYLLRSISFGIFSARCRAPHSLSAKVVGSGHLLLRWRTRTPELNPLHQEHYVVACRTVEGHTTSSACAAGRQHSTEPSASGQDSDVWKEWRISDNLLVNEENSWAAVLDCLPRNSCLRLRVCAENRWGRSAWAQDELEVETSHHAAAASGKVRSIPRAGARLCLRCRAPSDHTAAHGVKSAGHFADVVSKSLFAKECPHGPFCARCRIRVSEQAIPSCVCRALVADWVVHEADSSKAGPPKGAEAAAVEPADPSKNED